MNSPKCEDHQDQYMVYLPNSLFATYQNIFFVYYFVQWSLALCVCTLNVTQHENELILNLRFLPLSHQKYMTLTHTHRTMHRATYIPVIIIISMRVVQTKHLLSAQNSMIIF